MRCETIKKLNERYNYIQQLSEKKGVHVYLGYDEVTGSKIIIKEISKNHSKKENDYSILRRLRHPGLPVVCDAFELNGLMYIILEHIEGKNLREFYESKGNLREEDALKIVSDLLEVLDYMQSIKPKSLVHGDIKPENILISNGCSSLIDFGSVDSNDASSGFCAPERFAGIPKSIESDIYSLGELLNFLITGDIKKIYSRKKPVDMNNDVYKIIDKSTRKLPADRYHRPSDMAAEVHRVQQLRKSGVNDENSIKIICIPGCPEAACEMACAISSKKSNVLIVDLDMLSPSVHTILGVDKFKYCLQDFLSGDPSDLKSRCVNTKKSSLQMLPCRVDYENFENAEDDCITKIISGTTGYFDTIVISCNGFPYDKYFMDSLIYSDITIFPIVRGVIDIRKYNSMARFLCDRQNIPGEKMFFMGVDIFRENISSSIAVGAVETSWIGSIPNSPWRTSLYSSGKSYVFSMKKKIYSRYIRVLNKTGVLN